MACSTRNKLRKSDREVGHSVDRVTAYWLFRNRRQVMNKRLRIAFLIGLVVLTFDAIVPFVMARRVAQERAIAADIDANVRRLNRLLSAYKDTETGERGFMLSGKQEFLDPYISGRRVVEIVLPQIGKSFSQISASSSEYQDLLELDRQETQFQREQIAARRSGIRHAILQTSSAAKPSWMPYAPRSVTLC